MQPIQMRTRVLALTAKKEKEIFSLTIFFKFRSRNYNICCYFAMKSVHIKFGPISLSVLPKKSLLLTSI